MLDSVLTALDGFLSVETLGMVVVGVFAGLFMGIIPGLGGTGAVAILLPFVFLMEPQQALALIIGAAAVIHTSDIITAVLIGVPGSASSTVTLMDGHTMAQQGQAARALSIAFLASMAGGIIGAIGLTLSIPLARPVVVAFGSPELFMLTVLGISLAALLSRGNIVKGLVAGAVGLLLGQIGGAPATAEYRYTFGSLFLTEGLDIVAVALGTFGLAEILNLVARKTSVAPNVGIGGGWGQGVRDAFRHWGQVIRGACVGVIAGVLPGIGATAGSWMAYGQAIATSRDKRRFGKGDPRGVAAPEGANTSISAGDLIPTLLFGIPGSAAAALLLGALLTFGVEPGPRLITEDLDLVYTIIWSFALAAILGAALCFLLAKPLAKLSFVPFPIIAAGLVTIIFVSAFQAAQEFAVLQIMLVLGVLGWLMKIANYPRAPFLIGFVLSIPLERYYFLTTNLYDPAEWMTRVGVLVLGTLLVVPLGYQLIRFGWRHAPWRVREPLPARSGDGSADHGPDAVEKVDHQAASTDAAAEGETTPPSETAPAFRGSLWPAGLAVTFTVLFAVALLVAQGFGDDAKLMPQLSSTLGLGLSVIVLVQEIVRWRAERRTARGQWRQEVGWTAAALLWLCFFLALTYLLGAILAALVFIPLFLWRLSSLRWWAITLYTVIVVLFLFTLQSLADIAMPLGWLTPVFLV